MQQVWELMPAEVVYRETKTEVIMGNESGTWIVREAISQRLSSLENLATAATEKRSFEVYGVSEDDPKCIHTVEQAVLLVQTPEALPGITANQAKQLIKAGIFNIAALRFYMVTMFFQFPYITEKLLLLTVFTSGFKTGFVK